MPISFQCDRCKAPFSVDDKLAGRKARCKSCGNSMKIPAASTVAAAVGAGDFRLTQDEASVVAQPIRKSSRSSAPNWIDAVTSQVGLAPVTEQNLRAMRNAPAKASPLDDASSDSLYKVAPLPRETDVPRIGGKPASGAARAYRAQLGSVQKIFRWLNESAYLVSVPFLMLILIGITARNRSLAVLGAVVALLLNASRLITGLANLVVIPFRESPIQGIAFLIPPFTFFYLSQHWAKVRKPVLRIVGPLVTIVLVVAAFAFVPLLSGRAPERGDVVGQLKSGVSNLRSEVRGKVEQVPNLDVDQLQGKALEAVQSLENRARERGLGGPPGEGATPPAP
jgi:predicted Zn finger-like uncharacterized protein